ncbi:MAG: hypothetical protein ACJAZO_002774 [Myxococcota bacterium]|jgi:hypothetical protein
MSDRSAGTHFRDTGWAMVSGLIGTQQSADCHAMLMTEVAAYDEPLLRVLSGRHEVHTRDDDGRITNPVIHPGHLPAAQFPATHGLEQRILSTTSLLAYATQFLGAPVALLQSGWWPSSIGTPWHRDIHPVTLGAPILGVWLALEDIQRSAGAFVVYDRSHTPETDPALAHALTDSQALYHRQYIDKQRLSAAQIQGTHAALADGLARQGCTPTLFAVRAGTAVFWNGDTVHGSETPHPRGGTRSSLLFHFVRLQDVSRHLLTATQPMAP